MSKNEAIQRLDAATAELRRVRNTIIVIAARLDDLITAGTASVADLEDVRDTLKGIIDA